MKCNRFLIISIHVALPFFCTRIPTALSFFISKSKVPSFKQVSCKSGLFLCKEELNKRYSQKCALIFLTPIRWCEIAGISEFFCNPKAGFIFFLQILHLTDPLAWQKSRMSLRRSSPSHRHKYGNRHQT